MDAIVGIGSNLGSREAFLRTAARMIGAPLVALSSPYPTAPLGPPQPTFLNAAARVRTELAPRELLARMQGVEAALGRVRAERWGPRTIDLDLLWWEGGEVDEPGLRVPHPGLCDRAFALAPLLEVAPEQEAALGPRLRELGAPARRSWTRVAEGEGSFEASAMDDADALALALTAALGDPAAPREVEALTATPGELLERAGALAHRAAIVVESAGSGVIRARIARDPGAGRAPTALALAHWGGGRCVLRARPLKLL